MEPRQHFERVANVLAAAVRSCSLAVEMQEAARTQLEVIEFSIDRILDEVADVMALTPELAALRAPVHVALAVVRRAA